MQPDPQCSTHKLGQHQPIEAPSIPSGHYCPYIECYPPKTCYLCLAVNYVRVELHSHLSLYVLFTLHFILSIIDTVV